MTQFDATQLAFFTGSEQYYCLTHKHLLTDGTKYLADTANAYWLLVAAISHLYEIGINDWFVLVRLVVDGTKATMIYEDGNGYEHARQEIAYTDFPISTISIYACFNGDHWVLMLTSEY